MEKMFHESFGQGQMLGIFAVLIHGAELREKGLNT